MTGFLLTVLIGAPSVAVVLCLVVNRPRAAEAANLAASLVTFIAAIGLVVRAAPQPVIYWSDYIAIDSLGAWVILCGAVVYFLASIYAVGYMRLLNDEERLPRFYALFSGFALTILAAPVMNNTGLYWIAIELTTLVSTFLVAFEQSAESIEAAWKYIIVVSAGISLALLGTILFYWGGSFVNGPRYDLTWAVLRTAAPNINHGILLLSFFLVLIGYGTKIGLAPMHTWLPDAHSESPAPVSAMLSGALLNTAMLGVVRFLAVVDAAQIGALPRLIMIGLGVLSIFTGALFIVRQRGVKRLMAYSSVEHMGVVALGFGLGGPFGVAGALYHMLNHSLNKSLMFFGAGNAMRAYGTKQIGGILDVSRRLPVQSFLWLAGAAAITGAPPFGLFQSELVILRSGIGGPHAWAVYIMALLLIVVFIGFLDHFRVMFMSANSEPVADGIATSLSGWCVAPMWLAVVPLLIFGLWWPHQMWAYFQAIAQTLSGGGN